MLQYEARMTEMTSPHRLIKPILIERAPIVRGRGRGKAIGIPTINLELAAAPVGMRHGIYAAKVRVGHEEYMGAVHFGPRPVFRDSEALEVHIIDEVIGEVPASVDLTIIGFLREVGDFTSVDLLVRSIQNDIATARAMLQDA